MHQASFIKEVSQVAGRQPKTDPLFLARTVKDAAESQLLPADDIAQAHEILIKWADLEKSGELAKKSENELQGDFLQDIFGRALGYRRIVDSPEKWEQAQHPKNLAGQEPDAILGHFKPDQPVVPEVAIELKGPLIHLARHRSKLISLAKESPNREVSVFPRATQATALGAIDVKPIHHLVYSRTCTRTDRLTLSG